MATLPERLAENVTKTGTTLAYGEPVTIGGVDTVPVAVVGYGFGGGEDQEGNGGGGGGAWSVPIGVYVPGENGKPAFQPNLIALLAVGIPFVWVTGHSLRKIIKALKR